jgi:8-oxo-dGTP diphosphatase
MSYIHVVAAAIFNPRGQVLIAKRAAQAHQGGLWEFPGGKLEPGEAPREALARELLEELGILPTRCRRLITVRHAYTDKKVFLDVWRVNAYTGMVQGREGQPLAWVLPTDLPRYDFPAANVPIIVALS